MSNKLLCPFINGDCSFDCVFNNACFDEGDKGNCDLLDGINILQSLSVPDNFFDKATEKIMSKLNSIEDNTSSDHTESTNIKNTVEEIKTILENRE